MVDVGKAIGKRLGAFRKSARKTFAHAFYSIPSFAEKNPRNRITTIGEYCSPVSGIPGVDSSLMTSSWRLPILAPERIHREPALGLDDSETTRFKAGALRYQRGDDFEAPEVSLACIRQARVFSEDFLVLTPDDHILFESALSMNELLEVNGIFDQVTWPSATKKHGTACVMAQNSPRAFYHWIIEVLPKLSLLERFPELGSVPLILSDKLTPFQLETLQMLGVPAERILHFQGGCWQFDKLFFPMLLGPTGSPSPHAVKWLRERFLKHAELPTVGHKRLYLTRRDASQRRVLNEEEVIACLRRHGFEVVCPGDLSFAEQMGLFQGVEVVVAAHGASVTNMVFAPSGAIIIELFGDNYINGCFWALANVLGHKYSFVTGPASWLDYVISVESLERLLARLGVSR